MDSDWKITLWRQFGAAIDMLEDGIRVCPEDLWSDNSKKPPVWCLVHHTLFWLDYYLTELIEGFAPPPPFGLEELDPAGKLPERVYSKEELLAYLEHGRNKCRNTILALEGEKVHQDCGPKRPGLTNAEILLYNMRHVQHGAAQLNLILRQNIDDAGRWVGVTQRKLEV
jgi:hypothetical protein